MSEQRELQSLDQHKKSMQRKRKQSRPKKFEGDTYDDDDNLSELDVSTVLQNAPHSEYNRDLYGSSDSAPNVHDSLAVCKERIECNESKKPHLERNVLEEKNHQSARKIIKVSVNVGPFSIPMEAELPRVDHQRPMVLDSCNPSPALIQERYLPGNSSGAGSSDAPPFSSHVILQSVPIGNDEDDYKLLDLSTKREQNSMPDESTISKLSNWCSTSLNALAATPMQEAKHYGSSTGGNSQTCSSSPSLFSSKNSTTPGSSNSHSSNMKNVQLGRPLENLGQKKRQEDAKNKMNVWRSNKSGKQKNKKQE